MIELLYQHCVQCGERTGYFYCRKNYVRSSITGIKKAGPFCWAHGHEFISAMASTSVYETLSNAEMEYRTMADKKQKEYGRNRVITIFWMLANAAAFVMAASAHDPLHVVFNGSVFWGLYRIHIKGSKHCLIERQEYLDAADAAREKAKGWRGY